VSQAADAFSQVLVDAARERSAGEFRRALEENTVRRGRALEDYDGAREELRDLLRRGKEFMPVTEMARVAGISREFAYELIRGMRTGVVGTPKPRGGRDG
jgi:hypothetical protein